MYTFPQLIKKIREEAGLTQSQFADALGVSAVLIAMVETGQKDVSKNFILKLAEVMDVHPSSITPFLFNETNNPIPTASGIEKLMMEWGEQMQTLLIKKRALRLKKYANS